jgi:hypothetical protein
LKYSNKVKENAEIGLGPPIISNYLGECFLKIADNLAVLHKFRNYPFIEEMKSDAVFCCLKYGVPNFDPDKFKNPFGYFTKVSYWAFVRRIQEEKKNLYKKYKAIENTEIFSHVSQSHVHDDRSYDNTIKYNEHSRENMVEFIEKFETAIKDKKKKKADGK